MSKIVVNKDDIQDILMFREGTSHYEQAADRLYNILNDEPEETFDYVTVKWWALSHKRHYDATEHKIVVPKHFNDLQIQFTVRQEFDKIYNDINNESGFRWVKE